MVGGPNKGDEKLIVWTEFSISRFVNLTGDVGNLMRGIGSRSFFKEESGFTEIFFTSLFFGGDDAVVDDIKHSNFSEVVLP